MSGWNQVHLYGSEEYQRSIGRPVYFHQHYADQQPIVERRRRPAGEYITCCNRTCRTINCACTLGILLLLLLVLITCLVLFAGRPGSRSDGSGATNSTTTSPRTPGNTGDGAAFSNNQQSGQTLSGPAGQTTTKAGSDPTKAGATNGPPGPVATGAVTPAATTKFMPETTKGVVVTTVAAGRNTQLPLVTTPAATQAPAMTTKAMPDTTKAAVTTGAVGPITTIPATTKALAVITQAPAVTTQAPAATTKAPGITTQAKATTTKAPAITTQAPAVTTQAPAATTKAPSVTTKAQVIITQTPGATTKAPAVTTQALAATTKAPAVTTKVPAVTTQALAATTKAPAITTKASAVITTGRPANVTTAKAVSTTSGVRPVIPTCPTDPILIYQRVEETTTFFDRTWSEMKQELGSTSGNYWKGLDTMSALTSSNQFKLAVRFTSKANNAMYQVDYSTFMIGNEATAYAMTIGGYGGNFTFDAFLNYNGYKFTTKDRKNDASDPGTNCAVTSEGAWWYNTCSCDACLTQGPQPSFMWKLGFGSVLLKRASMVLQCK